MTPKPFPWDEAIGFGLGVLRLPPESFWAMTPRELALAIKSVTGRNGQLFARGTLDNLMTRFPDDRTDINF